MAVIDNGEDQMQRASAEVGRTGTKAVTRLASTSATELARALAKASEAVRSQMQQQRNNGKVSIRRLEDLSDGRQRDLVTLEDKEVVSELERSLNRRGVTYAIERDTVGGQTQYILHIQGKDANIVADSLDRASARVDAKREQKQQHSSSEEVEKLETGEREPLSGERVSEAADAAVATEEVPDDALAREDAARPEPDFTTAEGRAREWAAVYEPESLDRLPADPANSEAIHQGIIERSSEPFNVVDSEAGAAFSLNKAEALETIHNGSEVPTPDEQAAYKEWMHRDLDVDQAIVEKYGDYISVSDHERAAIHAHTAAERGVMQDETGRMAPSRPEAPQPDLPLLDTPEQRAHEWAAVFEPEQLDALSDPARAPFAQQVILDKSSGQFTLPDGDHGAVDLSKGEAIEHIATANGEPTIADRETFDRWLNRDLEVDQALATKYPDLLTESQHERITAAAERASERGLMQDEQGQLARPPVEEPAHLAPALEAPVQNPSAVPEVRQEWAPKPDMGGEKSLRTELLAKMEAAESKHLQAQAGVKRTPGAPSRTEPAAADTPKQAAPSKRAEPANVRERVRLRADAAREKLPKANLDAPARSGMKR